MKFSDHLDLLAAFLAISTEPVSRAEIAKVAKWSGMRTWWILAALVRDGFIADQPGPVPACGGRPIRLFKSIPGVVIPQDWRDVRRNHQRRTERVVRRAAPPRAPTERAIASWRPVLAELAKRPRTKLDLTEALGWSHDRVGRAVNHFVAAGLICCAGERETATKSSMVWALVERVPVDIRRAA